MPQQAQTQTQTQTQTHMQPHMQPHTPAVIQGFRELLSLSPAALKQSLQDAHRIADPAHMLMQLFCLWVVLGKAEFARSLQHDALLMRQSFRLLAPAQPSLRLLALMAPGDMGDNTPLDFVLWGSDVQLDILILPLDPRAATWPQQVPEHDVLFVAIGESSRHRALLQHLQAWLQNWPRPIMNAPQGILRCARDTASRALQGIAGLRMPMTRCLAREDLPRLAAQELVGDKAWILRPLDSQAGRGLARVDTLEDLQSHLREHQQAWFYQSEFCDYRDPSSGDFVKMRLVLIDGRPHVCHVAMSSDWIVHYENAGMAQDPSKRERECHFMQAFEQQFVPKWGPALRELAQRLELDYVVVDCAITPDDQLLIFEVDSRAWIHNLDEPSLYPYKDAVMQRAFAAMRTALLARKQGLEPRQPAPAQGLANAHAALDAAGRSDSSPPTPAPRTDLLSQEVLARVVDCLQRSAWDELLEVAKQASLSHPHVLLGWAMLGKAQLQQRQAQAAKQSLLRALAIDAQHAQIQLDLGQACLQLEDWPGARLAFEAALVLDPGLVAGMSNLGLVLAHLGDVQGACQFFIQAIARHPQSAALHGNLGSALRDLGRPELALAPLQQAVKLEPGVAKGHHNLGLVWSDLGRWREAVQAHQRALAIEPECADYCYALAKAGMQAGEDLGLVERLLEQSLALDPRHTDACIALCNVRMKQGRHWSELEDLFLRAQTLRPFLKWASVQAPEFSVLVLDTPAVGCTPLEYLMQRSPYESHVYCLLNREAAMRDLPLMQAKARVLVNALSDADGEAWPLTLAGEVADRLGCPVINHPRLIQGTDRQQVYERLRGTPHAIIPRTQRLPRLALLEMSEQALAQDWDWPLIGRRAGSHGGNDTLLCDSPAALLAFAAQQSEPMIYLTAFVQTRSVDGNYRKYRWIIIDGELFPYHLAIHNDWLVHHFRTDMAEQAWMREEEARFLQSPELVFSPGAMQALQHIANTFGLQYGGIDCALDEQGRVVLFETNATMLVHDETQTDFLYKNPHAQRIKAAFEAMLRKQAMSEHART